MKKKILFRADGNSEIGLGHLYRLFALVEMYKEVYEFIFITKSNTTISVIPKEYPVVLLPEDIAIEKEPQWLANKFKPNEYIVIADGYQFVSSYQKEIKKQGFQLMYIDDLTTEYMYADIVVNHSSHILETDFKTKKYTKFGLGLNYALLRPQFLKVAQEKREIGSLDTAFVCFGGIDKLNLSIRIVDILVKIKEIKEIHIICGAVCDFKLLSKMEKKNNKIIKVYRNLSEKKMVTIMQMCNFAIVPTSTILFELFCIKIPIYSGYFIENQQKAYYDFKKRNLVSGFGDFRKYNKLKIKKEIEEFIKETTPKDYILRQQNIIDGKQKERYLSLIKADE